MGLSGRKEKQRIPNDPRNLTWADDAARFGSSYLSKFGWDSSKGLGVAGEGRTSHIKVAQKLDMMGIGAAHTKDPNGIAWKQNKDFENLLARLNANAEVVSVKVEEKVEESVEVEKLKKVEAAEKSKKSKKDKKDKKRKNEEEDERPEKKKRRKHVDSKTEDVTMKEAPPHPAPTPASKPPPRFRAHRARAIAAKTIVSKSSAHISEILGIAPTPSSTSQPTSGSATPAEGKLTVISQIDKITTSTKSVSDYFKDKLLSKSSKSATPADASSSDPSTSSSSSSTPGLGSGTSSSRDVDYDDEVRPLGGLGFSRMRLEVDAQETKTQDETTMRIGLSKFSSLMSSTCLSASALPGFKIRSGVSDGDPKPTSFMSSALISAGTLPATDKKAEDESDLSSGEGESRDERKRRRKAEKAVKKEAKAEKKKEKRDKKEKRKSEQNSEKELDPKEGDEQKPKKKKSKHKSEDS